MPLLNDVMAFLPRPSVRSAIHRLWRYQEPELRWLDRYLDPSRTAIDVGAWWGPWTAALAKRCPQVHSFEPQPQLAAQLRSWAPPNVTVHERAVSDVDDELILSRPSARPGTDGLATLRPGGAVEHRPGGAVEHRPGGAVEHSPGGEPEPRPEQIRVRACALDGCDLDDVGFIKIDVEGCELGVLRGAEELLARDRPRLMVEIEQRHLDEPIDTVFDWLASRRYRGWFLRSDTWSPLDDFDVAADQTAHVDRPKDRAYINAFLFVPESDAWAP